MFESKNCFLTSTQWYLGGFERSIVGLERLAIAANEFANRLPCMAASSSLWITNWIYNYIIMLVFQISPTTYVINENLI